MIAFAASQYVLSSVDIIVLRAFRPASVVGAYALAYSGFSTLTSLAGSLTVVLVPLFVSLSTAGRSHVVVRYFQFLMPIAIFGVSVVGGMLAPVSASLIPLVFGAGFGSAAEPFAILVAGAMMLVIASCAAPIMMLHERTGATAMISTVALLVNVVGDLVLVGWVGASGYGPALATTAAMALTAVGYVVVASRDLGVMPSVNPAHPAAARRRDSSDSHGTGCNRDRQRRCRCRTRARSLHRHSVRAMRRCSGRSAFQRLSGRRSSA